MRRRARAVLAGAALAMTATPAQAGVWDDILALLGFGGVSAPAPRPLIIEETAPPPNLFPSEADFRFADTALEVSEKAGTAELWVERSAAYGEKVTVKWSTRGGSAAPGADFKAASGELTFGPDERRQALRLEIIDNDVHEPKESFAVVLTPGDRARVTQGEAVVTIVDDDPAPPPPTQPARITGMQAEGMQLPETEVDAQQTASAGFRNVGGTPATVSRVEIAGGDGTLFVTNDGCSGSQLAPGQSCDVEIVHAPVNAGRVQGRLVAVWQGEKGGGVAEIHVAAASFRPQPPPDPTAERVAAARKARRTGSGAVVSTIEPPPAVIKKPEYRMESEDYEDIGIGRSYFTFPVNRERIITTDRFIPCVLETAISSQLKGGVICVVETHVFGSDGRRVLVPAGTRVEGDYEPLAKVGDSRLNVIWRRFIRPDGSSILVASGFQSLDAMGRTGMVGEVDNRYFEKYGSAILATVLSAATAYASPADDEAMSMAQDTFAEGILDVTRQILEENLDLRPVTNIAAGSRLIIRPLTDLWLPRPEILEPLPRG